ncbi:MAG TPA: YggT family protein [Gaiellaceae bacterium]|nr:YggT family protein [Gaiellaceae bacterium]
MLLLDAIGSVQTFVSVFATVYSLTLIAYIITSWIRMPYSLNPVQRFLYDVCEPYLRLWRRLLPFSVGPLDLSPIVGLLALVVASRVVIALLELLH